MPKVSFNNRNGLFFAELREKVDTYFSQSQIKKTGNWKLYLKTSILIPAAITLYVLLLVTTVPVWAIMTMSIFLGLAMASIGFNVMHDACHGSYSSRKWVNNTLGLTLNALGGNAFIWKQKHNIIHHTYTNVDGVDDDIAKSPLIRQCNTQKWLPMHRVQHIYLILVYAITSIAWAFLMDFTKYFKKRVQITPLQKMSFSDHVIFWLSKLLYVFFYVGLPIIMKGVGFWLIYFFSLHVVLGITLAIVFQLAHVVEHTEFEFVGNNDKQIESEWAAYQVKTTANFATRNRVINWLVGGLNFQVEHHLFPRISHVHYPAISKIVEETCKKHGLPYHNFRTMWGAIVSHFRIMKQLGEKPRELATAAA
jgi:linoleoyl-CoA desaturase